MTPEHQALVERGRKVWSTFFYPKRTDFVDDDSTELKPATYLQMADCLRLALDEIEALNATLETASAELHHIMRTAEMSSGIMLDRRRTGNWPGAQKTADAFDRIGLRAAEAKANVRAALTKSAE